jgi:hypothetical protein
MTWKTYSDDALDNVAAVSSFLQSNFCQNDADAMWSTEYFQWKLGSQNPAGPGYLTIALENDKVAATVSLTKKLSLINGEEIIAGEVGDTYTLIAINRKSHPETLSSIDPDPKSFLNRSMFGRLASDTRARAESDDVNIIFGTPNKSAYPGWVKRLNYYESPLINLRAYTQPGVSYIIKRFSFLKIFSHFLEFLNTFILLIQRLAINMFEGRSCQIYRKLPSNTELDLLWQKTRVSDSFSLIRNSRYWEYRYIRHPLVKYDIFSIIDAGNLSGIVVCRVHNAGEGRICLSIVEWMLDENISFRWLLSNILTEYQNNTFYTVSYWADEDSREAKAGRILLFIPRSKIPVIFANNEIANNLLSRVRKVVLYQGNCDAI